MALTITDNSVRQINAALLSLEKKIGETNSEKAQDKQVVQMELKNIQYDFMAPLYQSGNSVGINTTGTWEGNARSATTAEHANTAANAEHADTATSADKATTATTATNATNATNANITKTTDTVNGDKLQIGSGTAQNVTNAKHAATADSATNADHATTVDTTDTVASGSTTPITSGGVYTALNGLIKTKDIFLGTITFTSNNYKEVSVSLTSNDTVIGAKIKTWDSNTDCFSVVCYGQNRVFLVGKEGTTVSNVTVTAIYI